jgi:uncharacterized membrane protein YuzA (DUF378 family)
LVPSSEPKYSRFGRAANMTINRPPGQKLIFISPWFVWIEFILRLDWVYFVTQSCIEFSLCTFGGLMENSCGDLVGDLLGSWQQLHIFIVGLCTAWWRFGRLLAQILVEIWMVMGALAWIFDGPVDWDLTGLLLGN